MHKYKEVDDGLIEIFLGVIEKTFPKYGNLKFKLIYDLEKLTDDEKHILTHIELPHSKVEILFKNGININGYDYILITDMEAWQLTDPFTKQKAIRHELSYIFTNEKNELIVADHSSFKPNTGIKENKITDEELWNYKTYIRELPKQLKLRRIEEIAEQSTEFKKAWEIGYKQREKDNTLEFINTNNKDLTDIIYGYIEIVGKIARNFKE